MSAESTRKFHGHMAKSAEADNADFLPLANLPVPERGVGCYAGAQERCDCRRIQIAGHVKYERVGKDGRRVSIEQNGKG